MGCGSSDVKSENIIIQERNDFLETKEEENIKKQVNQKQNDILEKYQKKKGNTNKVSLSNISSCFIKFWNTENCPKFSIKSKEFYRDLFAGKLLIEQGFPLDTKYLLIQLLF